MLWALAEPGFPVTSNKAAIAGSMPPAIDFRIKTLPLANGDATVRDNFSLRPTLFPTYKSRQADFTKSHHRPDSEPPGRKQMAIAPTGPSGSSPGEGNEAAGQPWPSERSGFFALF